MSGFFKSDRSTQCGWCSSNCVVSKEVQRKPYSSPTKHKVWLRFQSYITLIILVGGVPRGGATPPANA